MSLSSFDLLVVVVSVLSGTMASPFFPSSSETKTLNRAHQSLKPGPPPPWDPSDINCLMLWIQAFILFLDLLGDCGNELIDLLTSQVLWSGFTFYKTEWKVYSAWLLTSVGFWSWAVLSHTNLLMPSANICRISEFHLICVPAYLFTICPAHSLAIIEPKILHLKLILQ